MLLPKPLYSVLLVVFRLCKLPALAKTKEWPWSIWSLFSKGLRQIATSLSSTFFHNSGWIFSIFHWSRLAIPANFGAWEKYRKMVKKHHWTHGVFHSGELPELRSTKYVQNMYILNYHHHQLSSSNIQKKRATKDLHFQSKRLPGKLQAGQPWIPSRGWQHIKQCQAGKGQSTLTFPYMSTVSTFSTFSTCQKQQFWWKLGLRTLRTVDVSPDVKKFIGAWRSRGAP